MWMFLPGRHAAAIPRVVRCLAPLAQVVVIGSSHRGPVGGARGPTTRRARRPSGHGRRHGGETTNRFMISGFTKTMRLIGRLPHPAGDVLSGVACLPPR